MGEENVLVTEALLLFAAATGVLSSSW